MNHTRQIRLGIGAMALAAACSAVYTGAASHTLHFYRALTILTLAAASSRMKVKLPGINGNMSVNLPFLLTAVTSLSAVGATVVACVSTAVQCLPRRGQKFNPEQMLFNASMMTFASSLASLAFHATWPSMAGSLTPGLALAAASMFLGQTAPVAGMVAMSEGKSAASIWWSLAQLSFPYYVVSAGLTSLVLTAGNHLGWELTLGAFPVMYGIHRSFRRYFAGMAQMTTPERFVRVASAGT